MDFNMITSAVALLGAKGASALLGATTVTTAASVILKVAQLLAPFTPTPKDDKLIAKALSVMGIALHFFAINTNKKPFVRPMPEEIDTTKPDSYKKKK